MPAAVVAASITGAVQLGTSIYGAKKQGAAAKRSSEVQSRGATDALDFEKERDRLNRIEDARIRKQERDDYDRIEIERKTAWDAEEARKAPGRAYAEAARARMAAELGLPAPPPIVYPGMPSGRGTSAPSAGGATPPTMPSRSGTRYTESPAASAGSPSAAALAAGNSAGSMGNAGSRPQSDLTQYYMSSANMGPVQGPGLVRPGAAVLAPDADPEMPGSTPFDPGFRQTSRTKPMSAALQYRRQRER